VPTEIFKVTQLLGRKPDDVITVRDMQQIVTEMNKQLSEIGRTFGAAKGQDNTVPAFVNDIDMQGHDIRNVGTIRTAARKRAFTQTEFTGSYTFKNPAQVPVDAADLRDDLVANVLPPRDAAIQQLGALVKALIDIVQV